MKYKEKFDKEVKGKRPQYDLKESKIYQTLKDANTLASEVSVLKFHVKKKFQFINSCVRGILCPLPCPRAGEVQGRPEEAPQACDRHGRVSVHAAQPEHQQAVQPSKISPSSL